MRLFSKNAVPLHPELFFDERSGKAGYFQLATSLCESVQIPITKYSKKIKFI